jgi:hypothetical protein
LFDQTIGNAPRSQIQILSVLMPFSLAKGAMILAKLAWTKHLRFVPTPPKTGCGRLGLLHNPPAERYKVQAL